MSEIKTKRHVTVEIDEAVLSASQMKKLNKVLSAIGELQRDCDGIVSYEHESNTPSSLKPKNFATLIRTANKYAEELEKQKRRYLKRKDWNDPDQPPDAEVNKSSKRLPAQVSADHIDRFESLVIHFDTKRDALERAVELLAAVKDVPLAPKKRLADKLSARVSEGHLDLFNEAAEKFPTKRKALEYAVELLSTEIDQEI